MLSLEATLERVERLSRSGAGEDVRALVRLLGDADWQTRRAAAEAISTLVQAGALAAEVETDALFAELIAAVADKRDAGRRAAAVAALEGIGARALPALRTALPRADASSVIALAGLVGQAGGAQAVELLAPLVRHQDTNVAAAGIAALGRTRHPAATPLLLAELEAKDEWLRFAAVGALGELGDARSVPALEALLAEPLMCEAAASALNEIASVEACDALARNLREADGSLRPPVLAALVFMSEDERLLPAVMQEHLRSLARTLFREAADRATFSDVLRLTSTSDPALKRASITALGWLGDDRAVAVAAAALADPAFVKVARRALYDLASDPHALNRMLEVEPEMIPPLEIAGAIGGAKSYAAIETAARLAVGASDAETLEASLQTLAQARDWLREVHAELFDSTGVAKLAESLFGLLSIAEGRALIEIAETLGVFAPALPAVTVEAIADELLQTDTDDHLLARLAFLDNADPMRAVEEAARAERHRSPRVRLSAIEILSWRAASMDDASLAQHLTDEAAGVRRAAMRAMRRGTANAEAFRAVNAALSDDDIWVRAEALTTLGALFGHETEVRETLREALLAPHPLCRVAATAALAQVAERPDWGALAQVARRDVQPEARRAAVLAFEHCTQQRTILRVASAALTDAAWPVRRAAVRVLNACRAEAAHKLLLDTTQNEEEEAAVRGAALCALAERTAPETIELACRLISLGDPTLTEDAYAALQALRPTREDDLRQTTINCPPRAASVINFILDKAVTSDR